MKRAFRRIMPLAAAVFTAVSLLGTAVEIPARSEESSGTGSGETGQYYTTITDGNVSAKGNSGLEGKTITAEDVSSSITPEEGRSVLFAYDISFKDDSGNAYEPQNALITVSNISIPEGGAGNARLYYQKDAQTAASEQSYSAVENSADAISFSYPGSGTVYYTADSENAAEHGYDSENKDVSWTLDKDGVLTVFPTDGKSGTMKHLSAPWESVKDQVKKLIIKGTIHIGQDATSTDYYSGLRNYAHFTNHKNCAEMDLSGLDVSSLTSFYGMFQGNPALEKVNTTGWDTSNVTSMHYMFNGCDNLEEITGIEDWNVSNVTDMAYMLTANSDTDKMTALDLHKWRPVKLQDMKWFVGHRKGLKTVNTSGWVTPELTDLSYAFFTTGVEEVDMSTWKPQGAVNMDSTFDRVYGLKKIDLSGWGPESVVAIYNTYRRNWEAGADPLEYINIDGPSFSNGFYFIDSSSGKNLKYIRTGSLWGTFTKKDPCYFPTVTMVMDNKAIFNENQTTVDWPKGAHTYIVPLLSYDANGGEGEMEGNYSVMASDSAKAEVKANSFTRPHYAFKNWNTQADGKGTSYAAGDEPDLRDNMTLYAQWTADTYTIKYDANNEKASGTMSDTSASYDETVTLPENKFTAPEHMHFASWNTAADGTGTSYKPGQKVQNLSDKNNGTVTLYAQWVSDTYTIRYDANNKNASGTMSDTSATYDETVTLPENKFTASGYAEFTGWNTKADGTGTSYEDRQKVKNLSSKNGATVTLYAQWDPVTFRVKFNGNGSGSGVMKDVEGKAGDSITLPENRFVKDGYVFAGWNTREDGTGDSYDDKASFEYKPVENQTVTLYAQWKEAASGTDDAKAKNDDKKGSGLFPTDKGTKGYSYYSENGVTADGPDTDGVTKSAADGTGSSAPEGQGSVLPLTGDNLHMAAWGIVCAAAIAALIGFAIAKNRKKF